MSPEEHAKTWRTNINAKAQEIQNLMIEVLSLLPRSASENYKAAFQEKLKTVTNKCQAMHDMFGPNLTPKPLKEITQQLNHWQSNLTDGNTTRRIVELIRAIGSINGEEESDQPSFSTILEKHRQDATLEKCLNELISSLEKLLDAGDETLNAQAARELQRILDELKERKGKSLPDLQPWVDCALCTTGSLVDQYTGTQVGSLLASVVIAAKNSQLRLEHLFRESHLEYLKSLKLAGQAKWEKAFGGKLRTATVEDIQNAIDSPGGLKSLPELRERLALPPSSDKPV